MQTTVELQDMFSYSFILMALAVIVVVMIAVIALIVYFSSRKKPEQMEMVVPAPQAKPVQRINIKKKYCTMLNDLEKKCRGNQISNRVAYQQLSKIIRHFVHEATGVKVHNYTLEEIRKINMPNLYSVIAECYTPEFATENSSNIYETINRARKVIEEWN